MDRLVRSVMMSILVLISAYCFGGQTVLGIAATVLLLVNLWVA